MTLIAGELDETTGSVTAGSMAARIDEALAKFVPLGANEDPRGRRKLAVAIARGVLKHLQDHISAIHTTVPDTLFGLEHEQSPTIDIDIGAGPWP